jgi:hypothetical protein
LVAALPRQALRELRGEKAFYHPENPYLGIYIGMMQAYSDPLHVYIRSMSAYIAFLQAYIGTM